MGPTGPFFWPLAVGLTRKDGRGDAVAVPHLKPYRRPPLPAHPDRVPGASHEQQAEQP